MIERAAQFVPVSLDTATADGKKVAEKYGVRGLPTILFIDTDGEVQEKVVGYRTAEQFADTLDSLGRRAVSRAQSSAKTSSADGETYARLGLALSIRGELEDAESALTTAKAKGYRGEILGQSYNNIGGWHERQKAVDKAIEAYDAADRTGKEPIVRAYAKLRMAHCYRAQGDSKKAEREAKGVLRLDDIPASYAEQARTFLD